MLKAALVVTITGLCLARAAGAAVVYNESLNGEISSNNLAPTAISTPNLVNSVIGTSVSVERDFFTFTVPVGFSLTAITLAAFNSTDDLGFMAIQPGTTFPVNLASPDVATILGYTHFGPGPGGVAVGGDTLTKMGTGAGAIGFTVPLPAGAYTLWVQQTNAQPVGYQFDITYAPVPEPQTWTLLGLGLTGLLLAARRFRPTA